MKYHRSKQSHWLRTCAASNIAALMALAILGACGSQGRRDAQIRNDAPTAQIVELPHGTIAAVPGSPEDQLAKFMDSEENAPRTFRFGADEFTPWSDQLNARTRGTLATITLILINYPDAKIKIAGFTDGVGSPDTNLALSQHRVDRLKKLLIQGGISPSRIDAIGRGAAEPIGDNRNPQGRALNRRIELTVTSKD